jgi:hypothetical protein
MMIGTKENKRVMEVEKITFRLWPPYTVRVAEVAKQAQLNPNQWARIATMAMADGGLLDLAGRLQRIEETLIRLRLDFDSAVEGNRTS